MSHFHISALQFQSYQKLIYDKNRFCHCFAQFRHMQNIKKAKHLTFRVLPAEIPTLLHRPYLTFRPLFQDLRKKDSEHRLRFSLQKSKTLQYPPFVFPIRSIYPSFLRNEMLLSTAVILTPRTSDN